MNKIKAYRFIADLTQDELGKITGIDHAKISRIERGFIKPREEEKKKIATALNAEPEDLFQEV